MLRLILLAFLFAAFSPHTVMAAEGPPPTTLPTSVPQVVGGGPSAAMTEKQYPPQIFTSAPDFPQAGPHAAHGALVWLPGVYGPDQPGPPNPPDLVGRFAGRHFDVFQFIRPRGADPLVGSGETLVRGLTDLRARGYKRIVVAGHSRGAWIALSAMAHPGLADAVVAVSPGAFGTKPERQPEARASWLALWRSARAPTMRVVLVQLADDPYDPDPRWRLVVAQRGKVRLKSVYRPAEPTGHIGIYEPAFDEHLGAAIAAFADPR